LDPRPSPSMPSPALSSPRTKTAWGAKPRWGRSRPILRVTFQEGACSRRTTHPRCGVGMPRKIRGLCSCTCRACQECLPFETQSFDRRFQDFLEFCRRRLGSKPVEEFWVLFLDAEARVLAGLRRTRGTADGVVVSPKEVLREAVRQNAASVVFVHNHPNGDARPSVEDRQFTRALQIAGAAIGIDVYDHIIVTKSDVFSFRQSGLL